MTVEQSKQGVGRQFTDDLLRFLELESEFADEAGHCTISLPIRGRDGRLVEIACRELREDHIELSDQGETFKQCYLSGNELRGFQKQFFEATLAEYGAFEVDGSILMRIPRQDAGRGGWDFVSCLLKLEELSCPRGPFVPAPILAGMHLERMVKESQRPWVAGKQRPVLGELDTHQPDFVLANDRLEILQSLDRHKGLGQYVDAWCWRFMDIRKAVTAQPVQVYCVYNGENKQWRTSYSRALQSVADRLIEVHQESELRTIL